MIDGQRRGQEIGRELSRLFGVPGIAPEAVRQYAENTLSFLQAANFAHLEPDFITNFLEGWYERVPVRQSSS